MKNIRTHARTCFDFSIFCLSFHFPVDWQKNHNFLVNTITKCSIQHPFYRLNDIKRTHLFLNFFFLFKTPQFVQTKPIRFYKKKNRNKKKKKSKLMPSTCVHVARYTQKITQINGINCSPVDVEESERRRNHIKRFYVFFFLFKNIEMC